MRGNLIYATSQGGWGLNAMANQNQKGKHPWERKTDKKDRVLQRLWNRPGGVLRAANRQRQNGAVKRLATIDKKGGSINRPIRRASREQKDNVPLHLRKLLVKKLLNYVLRAPFERLDTNQSEKEPGGGLTNEPYCPKRTVVLSAVPYQKKTTTKEERTDQRTREPHHGKVAASCCAISEKRRGGLPFEGAKAHRLSESLRTSGERKGHGIPCQRGDVEMAVGETVGERSGREKKWKLPWGVLPIAALECRKGGKRTPVHDGAK